MKLATYGQVMGLLPKLVRDSAAPEPMESGRRLWVLAQIEAALGDEGLTWHDFAMHLMPPALQPGDLVRMANTIVQWDEHLTGHAREFLADLKRQGRQATDPVYLTERQSGWLWNLYRQAINRARKSTVTKVTVANVSEDDGSNVVYLAQRVTA